MTERAKQQYEHYQAQIEKIIRGHRDQEFEDAIVGFCASLSLSDLSQEEKELVFSKTLTSTLEGRLIRDIIKDYLDSA